MAERVYAKERQDVHPYAREWYTADTLLCTEVVLPYVHDGGESASKAANRERRIARCVAELRYQQSVYAYDRELARECVYSEDEWKMAIRQSGVPEPEPTCVTWWREQQERLAEVDAEYAAVLGHCDQAKREVAS